MLMAFKRQPIPFSDSMIDVEKSRTNLDGKYNPVLKLPKHLTSALGHTVWTTDLIFSTRSTRT